jgi:hypothetical protein
MFNHDNLSYVLHSNSCVRQRHHEVQEPSGGKFLSETEFGSDTRQSSVVGKVSPPFLSFLAPLTPWSFFVKTTKQNRLGDLSSSNAITWPNQIWKKASDLPRTRFLAQNVNARIWATFTSHFRVALLARKSRHWSSGEGDCNLLLKAGQGVTAPKSDVFGQQKTCLFNATKSMEGSKLSSWFHARQITCFFNLYVHFEVGELKIFVLDCFCSELSGGLQKTLAQPSLASPQPAISPSISVAPCHGT